jgi:hypothetical protein
MLERMYDWQLRNIYLEPLSLCGQFSKLLPVVNVANSCTNPVDTARLACGSLLVNAFIMPNRLSLVVFCDKEWQLIDSQLQRVLHDAALTELNSEFQTSALSLCTYNLSFQACASSSYPPIYTPFTSCLRAYDNARFTIRFSP